VQDGVCYLCPAVADGQGVAAVPESLELGDSSSVRDTTGGGWPVEWEMELGFAGLHQLLLRTWGLPVFFRLSSVMP
jgi:hypothetical protein